MNLKLHHPFWTHLPAAAMVLLMLVALAQVISLPDAAPVDSGAWEKPDRWSAAWGIAGVILMSLYWIGITVVWDELWARSEDRKRFNCQSLMDELVIGLTGGALLTFYLGKVGAGNDFPFSCAFLWFVPGGAAAAVLESLRPFRPMEEHLSAEDTRALESDVAERTASGHRWTYWELQNAGWIHAVTVLSAGLMAAAALAWAPVVPPWGALLAVAFLLSLILLCGGLRVSVTPDRVQVRVGILGLRMLNIETADVANVEVRELSPFWDYGLLGIRLRWKKRVYCFSGNRAVKLQTRRGKQYLIGSDHPERLAAVIGATLRAVDSGAGRIPGAA